MAAAHKVPQCGWGVVVNVKRRSLVITSVTVMVLGMGVTAPRAASAAPEEGWDPAAVALADEWRVPVEEAQARIDRQEPAEELAEQAQRVFGDRHAGVWIDQANRGAITVGFAGTVDQRTLDALAKEYGLTGHVAGVPVRHSLAALQRILDTLAGDLAAVNEGAAVPLSLGLRTDLNQVELTAPSSPTTAQASFVERARTELGDAVTVSGSDAVPETTACAFPYCDQPLRGGLAIHAGVTCSGGFTARSKVDSELYLLTAGHCAAAAPNSTWWTKFANNSVHNIGKPWNWKFGAAGDMAILSINNEPGWNPQPWVYVTASNGGYPTVTNSAYTIKKTGLSGGLIGKYLCKTGQTSGTSCGKLQAVGVTVSYSGGPTVQNLGKASIKVCKGDSGGPVYVKHVAYGLVSGGLLSGNCGNTIYYQGVKGAASAMNVNVLVSP
jgi:streptogrisin C